MRRNFAPEIAFVVVAIVILSIILYHNIPQ